MASDRYAAACGGHHTVLVLDDGTVKAFGLNDYGQCNVPDLAGQSCRYAACGEFHTVLVLDDGTVRAFGHNDYGQCSLPDLAGQSCRYAAAGRCHTVLVLDDGTVKVVGFNSQGQCDVPDLAGQSCRYAAVGKFHTVLVLDDGTVKAFGENDCGQCDVPDLAGHPCRYAAVGANHTVLVLDDGTVKAFGHNSQGQCNVPELAGKSCRYAAVGANHTVLVLDDGTVKAFGHNTQGQCNVPSLAGQSCRYAAAGANHTVLVLDDGTLKPFGDNTEGQCNVQDLAGRRCLQDAGVAVRGNAASVESGYFPKAMRAKVAMSQQGGEADWRALDDDIVKLKLGDLCRKAHDMGIEIDILWDALNEDPPHKAISEAIAKHKMEAALDLTSNSASAAQSAKELEATLNYAAENFIPESGIYFFIPKKDLLDLPSGRMPSFQELLRAGKLRAFRIEAKWLQFRKELRRQFVIGSHRWKKQHNPDPEGEQLAELQKKAQTADCTGEWFWLDFMCLPQDIKNPKGEVTHPRSPTEKKYYVNSLQNVNLLYLGGDVWILFDRGYNKRFWCLLEAYLSMRQANASGLISSLEDRHHTIICMGSTADMADKYKDMLESEMEKPLYEMLEWLRSDDADVTIQSDKDLMIDRMNQVAQMLPTVRSATKLSMADRQYS